MSSYEITFYAREDLVFGRDGDGNYTVTVKEGATPETIEIVDNDAGDGGDTFSGSTSAGATGQEAYGDFNGASFAGDPIQPLAALPGQDNPDDQIMAIGVGDPVHTVGYGFTYEAVPGETVTFDYDSYDTSPSFSADSLYVEGEAESSSAASGADDESSDVSAASGESSTSSGSTGASSTSGASGGASTPEESSEFFSFSGSTQPSATSGASGGTSDDASHSDTSGSSTPSGGETSGTSGGSDTSGATSPSGGSGPSGGGSGPSEPLCFTRGTAIRTARGEVLVEDLLVDDMVWTEGHAMQPIRWICQREVPAKGDFSPIRICAGTLGADRDILVSPAHRMLVQGPEIEVLFGMPKALVAAKDLVNDTTILRETTLETVAYFHILFDQHEILAAHGTLSESFFPHASAVGEVGAAQRKELFVLFPELEFSAQSYKTAYPGLMAYEVALLGR